MNFIFTAVTVLSALALMFTAPDKFMAAILGGAEDAAKMALTLFTVYAVWMGLSKLCEKSGLSAGVARALSPACRAVFKTKDGEICKNIAMNMSCNLLGLGGAATPYAVAAIGGLERENNAFAQKLLFVINATSIQVLPTTVIALRAGAGSLSPADIFLPSLICTAASTVIATVLFLAGHRIWR